MFFENFKFTILAYVYVFYLVSFTPYLVMFGHSIRHVDSYSNNMNKQNRHLFTNESQYLTLWRNKKSLNYLENEIS